MPSRFEQTPGLFRGAAGNAPTTRVFVIALLAVSLVGSLLERRFGVGLSLLDFRSDRIQHGQLWRLVTYPFVESTPIGLIISAVVLWLFGSWFEHRFGRRDFLRFFAIASIGAAILALGLSFVFNLVLPFRDVGIAEGPGAALNAMLVAIAVSAPEATVSFGFAVPMRARTMVLVLLAIQVIFGIQTGAATLSIHVGGMVMGYLLATGTWRPTRLWQLVRRLGRNRRRRGLYVVPPRNHTLN